jgi:hypothetical protein
MKVLPWPMLLERIVASIPVCRGVMSEVRRNAEKIFIRDLNICNHQEQISP